jgi:hypothetical protein
MICDTCGHSMPKGTAVRKKKYVVELTKEEHGRLLKTIRARLRLSSVGACSKTCF